MENNIKEAKPLTTVENTKTYDLALMDEEYELVMKLNESFIEFNFHQKILFRLTIIKKDLV